MSRTLGAGTLATAAAVVAGVGLIYTYRAKEKGSRVKALVERLATGLPQTRELTSNDETQSILKLADEILGSGVPLAAVADYVYSHCELPANLIAAVKAAEGYSALAQCPPCHVTVCFAMYHENRRVQPHSEANPNGQDFMRNKAKQLAWLFRANSRSSWELVAVDDGCDEGSGKRTQEIIEQEGLSGVAKVIYLQDGIDSKEAPFDHMKTTKDSRKGGSILYGLHDAASRRSQYPDKQHLVVYTDADLSMDLAQTGLLAHACLVKGHLFASAARYGYPRSFLVTDKGARGHPQSHLEQPNVVHIALRHFFRMHLLPDIAHLYDTNVGFKCFRTKDLPELVPNMRVFGPAFDMELLLAALKHYRRTTKRSAEEVVGVEPVLFVEDFAESNFTSNAVNPDATNEGFLRMAKEIAEMSEKFDAADKGADPRYETVRALAAGMDLAMYKALVAGVEKTMGRDLAFGTDFTDDQIDEAIKAGRSAAPVA